MIIADTFAAEFREEAGRTRRFLERFEDEKADWKPHDKSMSLGRLAAHVVESPDWCSTILESADFDFATANYRPPTWNTRAELLENHERISGEFLERLAGRSDEHLSGSWRMLLNGEVLEERTRENAIRNYILSHLVHHRGQLSVYYRLLGIAVPGPYGPSADDRNG